MGEGSVGMAAAAPESNSGGKAKADVGAMKRKMATTTIGATAAYRSSIRTQAARQYAHIEGQATRAPIAIPAIPGPTPECSVAARRW